MQHSTLVYPTLYASALITFNKGGYTKHYFEGTNRVCSKIGGGFYHVHMDSIENRVQALAGGYDNQSDEQRESVEHTFNDCLGLEVETDGIVDLYDVIKHESKRHDPEPAFFYHSDHLGSAAYLTNDAGQVTQTLNYLPYGEDWVDIQNNLDPNLGMYTYNGKEKDYESGFHYYGARYYWSELLTGWLSVDPMADKYPSLSPYNYCAWNPVKLIDPDGRIIDSASVTQNIKNMIDPTHECYNAEFAAIYQCLDDDKSTTYRFEKWDSFHKNKKNQDKSGEVSLSEDNTLIIGYTWGLETELDEGISPERALCEEIRHAKQFCDGEFGFYRGPGTSWMVCGSVDEEEAHSWAARVSGSTPKYDLSYYNLDRTVPSAEQAWVNDYKEKRAGTTPNYNTNGLYSSEFWFFKQPKNK